MRCRRIEFCKNLNSPYFSYAKVDVFMLMEIHIPLGCDPVCILPQHYMASQPRGIQLEPFLSAEFHIWISFGKTLK
jgi:hypothetical protein